MLNVDLRPVTAKWHKAHAAGVLNSRDGANEFRAELANVQMKLRSFAATLQDMAYGTQTIDDLVPDVMPKEEIDRCFEPLHYGIDTSVYCGIEEARDINLAEATEIAHRRARYSITGKMGIDVVGLSLSGGGIRSATFCLGVVQVLVNRKLMRHFDYLSTVSGGGYTGSFITSRIGRLVRVGQPSILVERQRRYFVGAKADQPKIEAGTLQVVDLDAQHGVVPAGVQRQLIVRKHIGALLRRRPACCNHDRDFSYPKLVRRKHAAMPGDYAVRLIDEHGNRPTPFADRRRDLVDLFRTMRAGIAGIRDQRGNRAPFNFICWPFWLQNMFSRAWNLFAAVVRLSA